MLLLLDIDARGVELVGLCCGFGLLLVGFTVEQSIKSRMVRVRGWRKIRRYNMEKSIFWIPDSFIFCRKNILETADNNVKVSIIAEVPP